MTKGIERPPDLGSAAVFVRACVTLGATQIDGMGAEVPISNQELVPKACHL